MRRMLVIATTILTFLIQKGFTVYTDGIYRNALLHFAEKNARLHVPVIFTKKSTSLLECAQICLAAKICNSLNFNSRDLLCQILPNTKDEYGLSKLIYANGWDHYQVVQPDEETCQQCTAEQACDESREAGVSYKCRDLENIAFQKATSQSSTCNDGRSGKAVDGVPNNFYDSGFCTHTCYDEKDWWKVDFGISALVYSVKITNRGDCCGERLSNFNILVGEISEGRGDGNAACARNQLVPQGTTKIFPCRPRLYGRFLIIQSERTDPLTLCELVVFGELPNE